MAPELGSDKLAALRRFLATLPADLQDRLGEALAHAREADPSFPADLVMEALHGSAPPAAEAELFDRPAPVDESRRYTLKEPRLPRHRTVPHGGDADRGRPGTHPLGRGRAVVGGDDPDGRRGHGRARGRSRRRVREGRRHRRVRAGGPARGERLERPLHGEARHGQDARSRAQGDVQENFVHEHVAEITRIMRCCEPILVALARIAPSGRVHELSEAAAEAAKPLYLAAASRMAPTAST